MARKRRRSDRPRVRPIFGSRRPLERAGETPAREAAKETPLVAQTVAARRARSAYTTSRLHTPSPLPIQATKRPSTRGCSSVYQIARKASPSLKRAMRYERPLSEVNRAVFGAFRFLPPAVGGRRTPILATSARSNWKSAEPSSAASTWRMLGCPACRRSAIFAGRTPILTPHTPRPARLHEYEDP